MKNVIKLTLAVIFMMSATTLFAQKFGRINTQEIITLMPEFKEMQTNMEAYAKTLSDQAEAINVEFRNKLQEFQQNLNTYPESVRDLKQKDLQQLQARSEEFQQIAAEDYQKKQNELLAPIVEKARNAINKVASAEAYTAIFDVSTGSLAYFNETTLTDISPAVKKELGITETAPAAAAK